MKTAAVEQFQRQRIAFQICVDRVATFEFRIVVANKTTREETNDKSFSKFRQRHRHIKKEKQQQNIGSMNQKEKRGFYRPAADGAGSSRLYILKGFFIFQ